MDSIVTFKELIEAVGFPIVACVALFWYINSSMKEQRRLLEEISKSLIQLVDQMRAK